MKDDLNIFSEGYADLTKKQHEIFEYIINNPDDVRFLSLKELAKRAGTSEVSVLKVCNKLGFDNFVGLKKAFQNHNKQNLFSIREIEKLASKNPAEVEANKKELFKMICIIEERNMTDMINSIEGDLIFKCAQELLKAREVVIFAHNASKTLADYLAHRLNYLRLKTHSVKLDDNDIVKTALARMNNEDFAVFFSFPPYHYPTVDVVKFVQMKGVKIATITDNLDSPAVSEGGYKFICKTDALFFYNSLSLPMKFVELLTSNMAIQLGEQLDRIIKEELLISKFINESN